MMAIRVMTVDAEGSDLCQMENLLPSGEMSLGHVLHCLLDLISYPVDNRTNLLANIHLLIPISAFWSQFSGNYKT